MSTEKIGKGIVILFLAFCLCGMAFAGAQKEAAATGPIELTYGVNSSRMEPVDIEEPWFKEMTRKSGFKIKSVVLIGAPLVEKYSVMVASGDLPDVFRLYGVDKDLVNSQFAKSGNLLNYKSYFTSDKMPNLWKWYQTEKKAVESYCMDRDGNMYVTPGLNGVRMTTSPMYRKDIFDKHGLKAPTNLEEFYKVLVTLKELYPQSYPLGLVYPGLKNLINEWDQAIWGRKASLGIARDLDTGTYFYGPVTPEFKEAIASWRKLYEEGLVNPEFLATTRDKFEKDIVSDKAFVTYYWINYNSNLNRAGRPNIAGYNMSVFPPFTKDGQPAKYEKATAVRPIGFSISNNSKLPKDGLVRFVDWLYSMDGVAMGSFGIEGQTYEKNPDVKEVVYHAEAEFPFRVMAGVQTFDKPEGRVMSEIINSPGYGNFANFMIAGVQPAYWYRTLYGAQEAWDQAMAVKAGVRLYDAQVPPSFSKAESGEIGQLGNELDTFLAENVSLFILGKKPMSEWDSFIAQIDKFNWKRLVEIYNNAASR